MTPHLKLLGLLFYVHMHLDRFYTEREREKETNLCLKPGTISIASLLIAIWRALKKENFRFLTNFCRSVHYYYQNDYHNFVFFVFFFFFFLFFCLFSHPFTCNTHFIPRRGEVGRGRIKDFEERKSSFVQVRRWTTNLLKHK